jgi:hypothetical protein
LQFGIILLEYLNRQQGADMYTTNFRPTPIKLHGDVSLEVVSNTVEKIKEQFYEFSHMESEFVCYDEKYEQIVDFKFEE